MHALIQAIFKIAEEITSMIHKQMQKSEEKTFVCNGFVRNLILAINYVINGFLIFYTDEKLKTVLYI